MHLVNTGALAPFVPLARLPVLVAHRDWPYLLIAAAQIVVLLVAAWGLLNSI